MMTNQHSTNRTAHIWTCAALLLLAVGGCSSGHAGTQPPATAAAPAQPTHTHGAGCPMMMDPATTQITTADTSNGVAVTFTTDGDVNDVRARARHMADMHNQMAAMHGGAAGGGMHGMAMVPSRATAEDLPGGARVVLVPADPAQLATLRQQVHMHTAMMQQGKCPMMEHGSQGSAG
jgi:DNA-binding transcriptional LysR family regulator